MLKPFVSYWDKTISETLPPSRETFYISHFLKTISLNKQFNWTIVYLENKQKRWNFIENSENQQLQFFSKQLQKYILNGLLTNENLTNWRIAKLRFSWPSLTASMILFYQHIPIFVPFQQGWGGAGGLHHPLVREGGNGYITKKLNIF